MAANKNVPMLGARNKYDAAIQLGGAALIAVGAFMVLQPFLTATLVAAVIAVSTWPLFLSLRRLLRGSNTWSAAAMVILLVALVVLPLTILAAAAADQLPALSGLVREWADTGVVVPDAIRRLPWLGERAYIWLTNFVSNKEEISELMRRAVQPASRAALSFAVLLGDGVVQLLLVTFVAFFFYRNGEQLSDGARHIALRLSGSMATEVLGILVNTTRSVVFGIVGTAMAQGLVALIGFLIAAVPGALLLGIATVVLSVVPVGPPLIWGGAAIWLYMHDGIYWAIFMVAWGMLGVSSVDNVLKPVLISRGSNLPLALIFLGVLGGVIAFGFVGLILGPVLLALLIAIGRTWMYGQRSEIN